MKKETKAKRTIKSRSNGTTEIVFILDRSGSMSGTESDTIGGYNALLEKQKTEKGKANVTTVLFDSRYELLHDAADILKVKPLSDKEYFVRSNTALLDAIGKTIHSLSERLARLEKPSEAAVISEETAKVLFVIITDGHENASQEYSHEAVKKLIDDKTAKGWEFIFLGADLTESKDAQRMGFKQERAAFFSKGTERAVYENMSENISSFRQTNKLSEEWKDNLSKSIKSQSLSSSLVTIEHRLGRLMVDTGSPISFGNIPEINICGQIHRLSQNTLLDDIQKHMGRDIVGLIGMDILNKCDIEISFDDQKNRFDLNFKNGSEERYKISKPLDVDFLMGIPVIKLVLDAAEYSFFLDTGAEISYIRDKLATGMKYCGAKQDFYPMLGSFETDTYEIKAKVSELGFTCEMGILPDALKSLMLPGIYGILGVDFLKQFWVSLGFRSDQFSISLN